MSRVIKLGAFLSFLFVSENYVVATGIPQVISLLHLKGKAWLFVHE